MKTNPFANYGVIVSGNRFIGRQEQISVIDSRIKNPVNPGNLAIIGEPRIGKSSLVYKTIIDDKDTLIKRKLIPIWINLGTLSEPRELFDSFIERSRDELKRLELHHILEQVDVSSVMNPDISITEKTIRTERYFETLRKREIRFLFILDEFDHARLLFKGDNSNFQRLRELSYRPECRVTYITTSRRSIIEIEKQTGAISTFDGIFCKHYLSVFNSLDLRMFYSRLEEYGVMLSADDESFIDSYCGGHPYLLEILGYEIMERFLHTGSVDISSAIKKAASSIISEYFKITQLLREDGSLSKLVQIMYGPVVDVKKDDIAELERYGILRKKDDCDYECFAEHFRDYLRIIERDPEVTDLWPKWRQTEKGLRKLLKIKMDERYGHDWPSIIGKKHEKAKKTLDGWRSLQEKEVAAIGENASQDLADFAYPRELFDVFFAEWEVFKEIFKKDKQYWSARATLLGKIRTPLAHNRDESIQAYDTKIADGYCGEILSTIGKYI